MRNLFLSLCFIVCAFSSANAQMPQATPLTNTEDSQRRILEEQRRMSQEFERLRRIGMGGGNRSARVNRQVMDALYRKPTKAEMKTLAPNEEDLRKYSAFLSQSQTGLTRLIADLGCAENPKVVVATEECLKYKMPGAGSSYSFRTHNYRIRRLADLTFTANTFQATGVLVHGILTGIGDVPLEQVSLQTRGMKYLVDFKPATDYENAQKIDRQLSKGVMNDGFIYRRGLNALENMTYVLRSIAYEGRVYRAIQGFTYNELDFDKRRDVIIAFRIVRKDADGSVTILWKELARNDAPEIKRFDKQKKLKETKFVARDFGK